MSRGDPSISELGLRSAVIEVARAMGVLGINQGMSGNLSVRYGDQMLVTPSATPYDDLRPEMIAAMPLGDKSGTWLGPAPPSSEWRMHFAILAARPAVGAVLHAHPPYCTALSIARRGIPPCHYMVAMFGGDDVRCAEYATFGSEELSCRMLAALHERHACLLAHHGAIVCGRDLQQALLRAVELEALAKQFCVAASLGAVPLLTAAEIREAQGKFATYGR